MGQIPQGNRNLLSASPFSEAQKGKSLVQLLGAYLSRHKATLWNLVVILDALQALAENG
jgi:hypothetical protein